MIDMPVINIADAACPSGLTYQMAQQQLPGAFRHYEGKEARGFIATLQQLATKAGFMPAPAPDLNKVTVHPMPAFVMIVVYKDNCVVGVARVPFEMFEKLMEYRYAEGDEANLFTEPQETE